MGKGDRKTRRGKITLGSYGVRRPRKKKKTFSAIQSKDAIEESTPVEILPTAKEESTTKKTSAEGKTKTTKKTKAK